MAKETHGLSDTKLYRVYWGMISRIKYTSNTRYESYGGRGISICEEWLAKDSGFLAFYNWSNNNGYQEGLTLDRIDVDGDYEPSNCRWITNKQQQSNRTNNRLMTLNGVTKTITEWSESLGGKPTLVQGRLDLGWSEEDALTKPVTNMKSNQYGVKLVEYQGKKQSMKDWADEVGLPYHTLARRLNKGWDIDRAMTTPLDTKYATRKK
ncbi:helix-turn-helix DNA binding domain protein [Bacillus phage Anthos]|uniref:Helix-turn-helix DNA binding domain protein n=1 Tax=Bacillus phage Anthos TaxID=2796502 RepID=A0A7U3T981_9CAUD|nr:helix-turn-helix DNA binding domain protein [Bacillus phage Anthos]